jgi:two-component sensor histidine kinase
MIDISSRKEREEEYARLLRVTEEQRTRSESMREVTLALTSTFDSSRVLDTILSHAQRLVSFTAVNVSLLEEDQLRIVRFDGYEQFGVDTSEVEEIYNRSDPENIRRLTEELHPVLIPDTRRDPNWLVCPKTSWVRSFLGMPMTYGDQLIGMINFDSHRPGQFTDEDIRRLEPFVNAAAVALENARLYEELERELSERTHMERRLRSSLCEKEILLQEINHRVKNNLNVVGSILSLQLNRITSVEEAREALQVSENRIHSMSLVHEHLYQSEDLSAVDMRSYIEILTGDLRNVYQGEMPVEVSTSSEEIYLDIHQAIPLGLILNELISNALEHAFAPETGGRLTISLSAASSSEEECQLRVKDDGRGLPDEVDPEESETLGLKLVSILGEQLGGRVEMHRGEGTEFILTFPSSTPRRISGKRT